MMRLPLADCRLYAFVDADYLNGRDPAEVARQLCDGGADLIQLRAKPWPVEEIARVGERLRPICETAGVRLVINDHPGVALRIGAPLIHVGQEDFFDAGFTTVTEALREWRKANHGGGSSSMAAPASLSVGISTHAPAQAERAIAAGADYVAIGPVFATPTKPGRPGVTVDYVRWAAKHVVGVPWFAIGGINLGNLEEVLAAGATRVCVVSAILDAPDIAAACREFRGRLLAVG